MKTLSSLIFVAMLSAGLPAIAGPGHEHGDGHSHSHGPISADKARSKAIHKIEHLVKKGKVDVSWAKIKPDSVSQKDFGKGKEWVVVFKNPSISDGSKQTLYVFYKLDGQYLATNYTGQ